MKNIELQALLATLPPDYEVGTFCQGNKTIREIIQVYIGNEKYIPNGKRDQKDKVVIEYKR